MKYNDDAIERLQDRLLDFFMKKSTPLKYSSVMFEAVEVIRQLKEQAVPPTNAPLPLEELQEMDGEPVWVVSLDHVFEPCWMLVMVRHDFVMANWQVCDFKEYGKTWLAYRRRSEEGMV